VSDIRLERNIQGPRGQVISAWREPPLLAQWFCPNPSTTVTAEIDFSTGGLWRVFMGEQLVTGNYVEIDLPEKFSFTWRWEHEPDVPASTVRLQFTDRGDATELLLEHVDLANPDEARSHSEGWAITLDRLDQLVRAL
jgi:uncharacterized protein YndB with AHSA1/START domain